MLAEFMRKALPDRFHAESDMAVSPRDWIVRELVSNILVHREYSSPIPAQIAITNDGIETRNASRPAFEGEIDLGNFTPVPKNPVIADVFSQIGLAEELGSGVRNLVKYTKIYSGGEPAFRDGLVFTAFVPIDKQGRAAAVVDSDGAEEMPIDEAIEHLLAEHDTITISQIARLANADARAVRRKIAGRVRQGELVALGHTRNRRYMRSTESPAS